MHMFGLSPMQTNYFVCTLGQAAAVPSKPKPYRTIGQFVRHQAHYHPHVPAVGFPIPGVKDGPWGHQVLTFGDVDHGARVFAERLLGTLGLPKQPQTIALLCHSSPDFLFTWLALMTLGYSVLLIAPQCQPPAIVHLCTSCEASVLIYDSAHEERALQTESLARDQGVGLESRTLPLGADESVFEVIKEQVQPTFETPDLEDTAVAYLHHTSGTSSGLPKPIPQSHRAGMGVLPHLPRIHVPATFTTTPLYHGGIADLFRAWSSNALIWLFPSKDVPISALNVCKCLDTAASYSATGELPVIKYFSSVPYVLQMMEADTRGLVFLEKMDIVGVGGAALPAEVGDRLVQRGVNLISRFGSAECGFSLSSYRDFSLDKDWQYLRNYNPPSLIDFEPRDDDLAELVIKPGWPHMAKTNRPDGSFATADLFAPHPIIKDAWLYHSRADSQLTLITGKKFDPAPLEDAIATSSLLDDVLIFGNNRPYPGALLLRSESAKDLTDQQLLDAIKPTVEKLNRDSQDHARLPQHMLVPVPMQANPLEKSSKGTIIRKVAESRFADTINAAYETQDDPSPDVADDDLPQHLTHLIQSITAQSAKLEPDMDLFAYGVDSIACMQLRTKLRHLVPSTQEPLPMSVVEDCGTVKRLVDFVVRARRGEAGAEEDEHQLMRDLVEEYGNFDNIPPPFDDADADDALPGAVVLLTGATGALGAHILDLLQRDPSTSHIYCLVRASSVEAAHDRLTTSLTSRLLAPPTEKTIPLPSDLSHSTLGLSPADYKALATKTTHILHLAWTVNFRLSLRSFTPNLASLHNLITLALVSPRRKAPPPTLAFCSSTASTTGTGPGSLSNPRTETLNPNPAVASPLGYSRSKWIGEHVCALAHRHTRMRDHIAIIRAGQLSGSRATGAWNRSEAWPLLLSSVDVVGALPALDTTPLDWLPVDVAAKAVVEVLQLRVPLLSSSAHTPADNGATHEAKPEPELESDADVISDPMVLHILNPSLTPTFGTALSWLRARGARFDIIPPLEWVRRLEGVDAGSDAHAQHPALKLVGLWRGAFSGSGQDQGGQEGQVTFETRRTRAVVPCMRDVGELDEEYVWKVWGWIVGGLGAERDGGGDKREGEGGGVAH